MVFGTDGVRGIVDEGVSTEIAYNIGKGLAWSILDKKLNKKVVIGKDTRLSSDAYVSAIACGLSDYGIDVVIMGIVSTPMVSFVVSKYDFGGGIMITASHNDKSYNGIKVFDELGHKLCKDREIEIETINNRSFSKPKDKGKILYDESYTNKYIESILKLAPSLSGLTIAVDCANGSNYSIAPHIYKTLGANVVEIACCNDGNSINDMCGANHIDNLISEVKSHNVDYGFAFDGDGDRLRIVLSDGKVLSGDDIMFLFALQLKNQHMLNNLTVVGTIMSNMGLEYSLLKHGITMLRTDVGDKNVIQLMRDKSLSLGGESSGHICLYNYNPTCDALLNSLFFLKIIQDKLLDLNLLISELKQFPSITKNIHIDIEFRKSFNSNTLLQNSINKISKEENDAHIVVRPSGTEPVIRIYVESDSELKNNRLLEKIEKLIKKYDK